MDIPLVHGLNSDERDTLENNARRFFGENFSPSDKVSGILEPKNVQDARLPRFFKRPYPLSKEWIPWGEVLSTFFERPLSVRKSDDQNTVHGGYLREKFLHIVSSNEFLHPEDFFWTESFPPLPQTQEEKDAIARKRRLLSLPQSPEELKSFENIVGKNLSFLIRIIQPLRERFPLDVKKAYGSIEKIVNVIKIRKIHDEGFSQFLNSVPESVSMEEVLTYVKRVFERDPQYEGQWCLWEHREEFLFSLSRKEILLP